MTNADAGEWERNGRSVFRGLDEPAFILTVESEAVELQKMLNTERAARLKAEEERGQVQRNYDGLYAANVTVADQLDRLRGLVGRLAVQVRLMHDGSSRGDTATALTLRGCVEKITRLR